MKAPRREVVRVTEVIGPRGGVQLVHVMSCGHWMTSRKPATELGCIGCAITADGAGLTTRQLAVKAVETAVVTALDDLVRQVPGVPRTTQEEARVAGICAAMVYLNEIR